MRVEPVTSLDDPRLAIYRDVRDSALRARDGLFLAEGRLNVERLLTAPRYRTRSVFVTEAGLTAIRPALARLDATTPVYVASKDVLCRVVGYAMHRGCLAAGERGEPPALRDLVAASASSPEVAASGRCTWLVLEDVTDPENVGALFRNAQALGASGVALTPRSVDPLYRRAIRVSMGATLRIPYARDEAAATREVFTEAGFANVALTPGADATPISAGRFPARVALWLGSEGGGLAALSLRSADLRVRIPMAPGADSLNVAMAAGIALHHLHASRRVS